MQEDLENRSVTLMINTSKLTGRVLTTAFLKYLEHSKEKKRAQQDVKPQGKQTVKELIAQNQGVEKTELADKDEAKAFDRIAKKYGVDYAIEKGVSADGKSRYMLFFKARDRGAIDQAMAAYAMDYMKKHKRNHNPVQQATNALPAKAKKRTRSRGLAR